MVNIMSYEKYAYTHKLRKSLNMLIVKGVVKGHFLWRDKPFELIVYYTPIKKKVIDYNLMGMEIKDLEKDLSIGDEIKEVKDWANKNGYEVKDIIRQ